MAKILIIGGGVAGLTAGIYALLDGHDAVIYEKNKAVGGALCGWNRGEYHIDNCIHWLTGTNPHTAGYRMWETVGALGNVPVYQGESLYTCAYEGERMSLYSDLERLEGDMLTRSPRDREEILFFTRAVREIQKMIGIGGTAHDEGWRGAEKIRALPSLYRYYRMTTGDLATRFSDPLLRKFFVSLLTEAFGALAFLCVVANYTGENGGIPVGGSVRMAERMKERFLSLGGELHPGVGVTRLRTEGRRAVAAVLSDGTERVADFFLPTTDPAVTFGTLLSRDMPPAWRARYRNPRTMRFSSYHAAFAADAAAVPFHGDFILDILGKYRARLGASRTALREFSHETSFAPAGRTVLQTLTFCDEHRSEEFLKMRENPTAYLEEKRKISDIMQTIICEKFPALGKSLSFLDAWTPATYRRYLGSDIGS